VTKRRTRGETEVTTIAQGRSSSEARPTTLNAAIVLLLINAFAPYPFLPTINGLNGSIIGVTVALSVLFTAGAWGLWMRSKKAGIAMIVVSAVNLLLSVGSIFSAPEGSPDAVDRTLGVVGVAICAATIAFILARSTRKALR
jgi:hypothetical protein